ncbi:His Kinase A (phospho-acceptor) domain-containing protein [Zhouia amylolytica]|uniref:histidine kinase n=1 Tax=Zhouia amylolytica TaxID=376730 RepID=A0A1I6VL78_9FLAO|nr:HAMP domain-containing sensor histidine kinase [Zhouia amylolytica]SFT14482.1 His Kinase A (phospho-acceptor) domain-containing protein [Zhouia amylolytica]
MNQRIRIIFFLVSVSIIGLVLLQAHWIGKFYHINKQQLIKELNLALEKSVNEEMSLRYSEDLQRVLPNMNAKIISSPPDSILNKIPMDLLSKSESFPSGSVTMHVDSPQYLDEAFNMIDSVPESVELKLRELVQQLISEDNSRNENVQLSVIDSLFRSELNNRAIDMDYRLDVLDSSTVSKFNMSFPFKNSYLASRTFPLNFKGNKNIRVVCTNVRQVLYAQFGFGGLASLALFILIMICFVYMLRTIFRQKQLSQIKSDFINNMTHELKTPIATVSAIVESMKNFGVLNDREMTDKYLDSSQKELTRLSGLVEKVLNMSREEREPAPMHPEEVNFRELCQNILNDRKYGQINKKVKVELEIEPEAERIWVDRFHMVNVMQNLFENSIKYSIDDVLIKVAAKREHHNFLITITDNGIGISKVDQKKIFDRFYRVSTGSVHNTKGFGLGLYYVKNTIEKHGGTVAVRSELKNGTTIIIVLPVNYE